LRTDDNDDLDITTRGKYYPDRSRATPSEPPLHLFVSATSQEILDKAVARIEEILRQEPGAYAQPATERRPREDIGRDIPTAKVYLGFDPPPGFHARPKIIGPQGAYVKHIQNETGSRVQIRGAGSGYTDPNAKDGPEEPLHLLLSNPNPEALEESVQLAKDLMETVRQEYERMRSMMMSGYGRGGYMGPPPHDGYYRGGVPPPPPPPPPPPGEVSGTAVSVLM
jgi:hypothetical protein